MNHIVLHGRMTDDAELKNTNSGLEVVNFKVAVDRFAKDKDGNKITDFIPCVSFGKGAAFISQYFHKGDGIVVEGSLQMRNYTDKEGNKRTAAEVVCNHTEFAEKKQGSVSAAPATTASNDDEEFPF